jgi:hypothetical protein
MSQGEIVELSFTDANIVDDFANKPYDAPPWPLEEFMGSELFLFRDTNFWADFPTSARAMMASYQYGQDSPQLAGVIAIDIAFVADLVASAGSLYIPEENSTVQAGNVEQWVRQAWGGGDGSLAGGNTADRKQMIWLLAAVMIERMRSDPASLDLELLAKGLLENARFGHLQVYIDDPEVMDGLKVMPLAGVIPNLAGEDQLMAVDTSMGFNKVSPQIRMEINYTVELDEEGTGTAQVMREIENRSPNQQEPCLHGSFYTTETTYESLTIGCYWDFVRFLAPSGSTLLESYSNEVSSAFILTGVRWPGELRVSSDPTGLTVFEDFLLVPPRASIIHGAKYQLPPVVQEVDGGQQYNLTVYKQAGAAPQPLSVTVVLPPSASGIQTNVPAVVTDQTVEFATTLDEDKHFSVFYR